MHIRRYHGGGAVGTHATGVRALVGIEQTLVILRCRHRQHILAIDHDRKAGLFAIEEFLDHHARAGIAKAVAFEHVIDGCMRFVKRHCHDHALACRQAK